LSRTRFLFLARRVCLGWGNPYFTADAQQNALEHLQAADYFLIGRVTYELLHKAWGNIKGGAYLDRMNEIPSWWRRTR